MWKEGMANLTHTEHTQERKEKERKLHKDFCKGLPEQWLGMMMKKLTLLLGIKIRIVYRAMIAYSQKER